MTHRELFAKIEEVIPTLQGWCTVEKASEMAAAIVALRPSLVVEIGVFGGKSLLPMALALKHINQGTIWAIDPWSAAESIKDQTGANLEWWSKNVDHDQIYGGFMQKVGELGVSDRVLVFRKPSDEVNPPPNIDILHSDGNHGMQALRDVQRYGPKVKLGGLAFLDDIGWEGGGVAAGVEALKGMGFRQLYSRDTGALFQRHHMPQ